MRFVVWALIAALLALCSKEAAAKPQDSTCGLHIFGAFVTRPAGAKAAQDVARVALVLSAPQPELVSGTLRLYSGNERLSATFEKAAVLVGPTGIFVNVAPPRPLDGYDAKLNAGGGTCELSPTPFMPPGPEVRGVMGDDATATAFVTGQQEQLPPLPCGVLETSVKPRSNLSPQLPDSLNIKGSAEVVVLVAADGGIESTEITKSSGNTYFDNAALATARRAAYRPATYRCKPFPGIFVFRLATQ